MAEIARVLARRLRARDADAVAPADDRADLARASRRPRPSCGSSSASKPIASATEHDARPCCRRSGSSPISSPLATTPDAAVSVDAADLDGADHDDRHARRTSFDSTTATHAAVAPEHVDRTGDRRRRRRSGTRRGGQEHASRSHVAVDGPVEAVVVAGRQPAHGTPAKPSARRRRGSPDAVERRPALPPASVTPRRPAMSYARPLTASRIAAIGAVDASQPAVGRTDRDAPGRRGPRPAARRRGSGRANSSLIVAKSWG